MIIQIRIDKNNNITVIDDSSYHFPDLIISLVLSLDSLDSSSWYYIYNALYDSFVVLVLIPRYVDLKFAYFIHNSFFISITDSMPPKSHCVLFLYRDMNYFTGKLFSYIDV